MGGIADELSAVRGNRQVDLGKTIEGFIDTTLIDFTHLTVMMFLVRRGSDAASCGDIAKETGDPKRTIQAVLDRFMQLELIRSTGGFFSTKYVMNRDNARYELVTRLIKLWEHPQAHEAVLRRVLAVKK